MTFVGSENSRLLVSEANSRSFSTLHAPLSTAFKSTRPTASGPPAQAGIKIKSRRAVLSSDASRPGEALPSRHPGNLLPRIPTFPTQKERRSEIPYRSTTG